MSAARRAQRDIAPGPTAGDLADRWKGIGREYGAAFDLQQRSARDADVDRAAPRIARPAGRPARRYGKAAGGDGRGAKLIGFDGRPPTHPARSDESRDGKKWC